MFNFKLLGGGIQGISPTVTTNTQQGCSMVAPLGQASQIPLDREVIRNAFPSSYVLDSKYALGNKWAQTPFRIVMNAGDLYSRQTEPGGVNQVKGSVGIGQYRNTRGGSPSEGGSVRTGNGASGNQHFVYDSSDYIRFKRLMAKNKNYNDYSFGGDQNNASYPFILAVRRY